MNKNYKVNTGHITLKKHPTVSTEFVEPLMTRSAEKGTASIAFTLVELLVVVAVIGILAGLVLAAAGAVQKKAARDQAKADIKMIASACEDYKARTGQYPKPSNLTNFYFLLTNLLTMKTNQVTGSTTNLMILDPYGYPYRYRSPARSSAAVSMVHEVNDAGFEIWSAGANGRSDFDSGASRAGTNSLDDITSWQ
jgi:type II secretion system protein G